MSLSGVWKLLYTRKMIKITLRHILLWKTFIGSKANLPPVFLPPQNQGCHCVLCPVLIHTPFLLITGHANHVDFPCIFGLGL